MISFSWQSKLLLTILVLLTFALLFETSHAQNYVATTNTYFAGYYSIKFNSTIPVTFGATPTPASSTPSSSNFQTLLSNTANTNGVKYVTLPKTSDSTGDYFSFYSSSPFQVTYTLNLAFLSMSSYSSETFTIPAYGIARYYSSSRIRRGYTNTLKVKKSVYASTSSSFSIRVAYTFTLDETPQYSTYYLSGSSSSSERNIDISGISSSSSLYPSLYIHVKCDNGVSDCPVSINIDSSSTSDSGWIAGVIIGPLVFVIIVVLITVPLSIIARKRRMLALAAMTANRNEFATSSAVVGQPTMPPGAYGAAAVSQTTTTQYYQPTMPPGAYGQPGYVQPQSYQQSMPQTAYTNSNVTPYVGQPTMPQQAQYYQPPMSSTGAVHQQMDSNIKPSFNPNVDL